jgi:aminopeptidase-like protein
MRYGLVLILLIGLNLQAQNFKKHIAFLASDSLHGRGPNTTDELKAANYITAELKSKKLKTVFQKLPFKGDSATNVLVFLDCKMDSTIILSAHYDHLGMGTNKSKELLNKHGIHNGADDNASGVAMVIELAKWLAKEKKHRYNYVFAFYSAHEAGLYGSAYFGQSSLCSNLKIRAVLNFDMVGRLDETAKIVRVAGAKTDPVFDVYFESNQKKPINFRYDDGSLLLSDLKTFAEKNLPTLGFSTGIHDDYHKMSDDEDKINYPGMLSIYGIMKALLLNIEKKPQKQ